MIPIEQIQILNPRRRRRRQHEEIIENIRKVGLRRPITVSRRSAESFDLVCGQGRLEAFRELGQTAVPAFVLDLPAKDCMLMGLVENVARRHHSPQELLREIGQLIERGHTEEQVATLVGTSESWVRAIVGLIRNGEDRLISAVATGLIPISLATDIAKSSSKDSQKLLADVYESGEFRGRRLIELRRLIERRATVGKLPGTWGRNKSQSPKEKKLTAAALRRLYQQEASRHKIVARKAELAHTCLILMTEAFRDLFAQPDFVQLLRSDGSDSIPQPLADRLSVMEAA